MAFTLAQIGSHEVQVIITVTLLVATSAAALLCDYLRVRMYRKTVPVANIAEAPPKLAIAPTLVPDGINIPDPVLAQIEAEIPMYVPRSGLASRLAMARQQPRRVISPEAQAIIERTVLAVSDDLYRVEKKSVRSHKKSKAQHAG